MAKHRQGWCGIAVIALAMVGQSYGATRIDLDGPGWTFSTTLDHTAQNVTVPHCWFVTQGYRNYIGDAVYQRDFDAPALLPGQVVRLHFDGVFYKAHVWLNGRQLGMHEGGYTAFEFEVSKVLHPGRNHLFVEVDNMPTYTTIPSLEQGGSFQALTPAVSRVARMPYGGIVRPVSLLITDAVYLRGMKIEARPDLKTLQAAITVRAFLHNGGDKDVAASPAGTVTTLPVHFRPVSIPAGGDAEVEWTGVLPNAHLWSVRDPFLYDATLTVPGDELTAKIGVREIRVQGTELLLNGRTVHLFGANRLSEDPDEGLRESAAIIDRDLSDMLAGNMRMMRIAHHALAQELLDFADAHGMLLIAQGDNWQLNQWQMADPGIRAFWQHQMHEMMEQEWNHPSVIAWSVGNEFPSATKEGIDWVRDMRAFTLNIDSTRLITFASNHTIDASVHIGVDEASQYSDFVSVNMYVDFAKRLDRVHELWPDKPVFVTEFGELGEHFPHDADRVAVITTAVEAMKARPWVIGGSVWTWADYRSLYPDVPADGIRKCGIVDFYRGHRDSWDVVQKLFNVELP